MEHLTLRAAGASFHVARAGGGKPLVLLHVDEALLTSPVVEEVGNPVTGETFPHVYGPIDIGAVVGTTVLQPPHDGLTPDADDRDPT